MKHFQIIKYFLVFALLVCILNSFGNQYYKISGVARPAFLECGKDTIISIGNDTTLKVTINCKEKSMKVVKRYSDSLLYSKSYTISDTLSNYFVYSTNPRTLEIDTNIIQYFKVYQ